MLVAYGVRRNGTRQFAGIFLRSSGDPMYSKNIRISNGWRIALLKSKLMKIRHLTWGIESYVFPARKFLHIALDFVKKRTSIELSPPIQFRIEWADSQGMSPLLGCRPI
jgi:hypothetical protein